MSRNVIVVGGGLAGLAAATYLARAGHRVTIFEKKRQLGGRAVTHLRHGYRFNLGPHAFYRLGGGAGVLRELGVPVRGRRPKTRGVAIRGGEHFTFPAHLGLLMTTGLLSMRAKLETAKLFVGVLRLKSEKVNVGTIGEWLDQNVTTPGARELLAALIRLATYCEEPERLDARVALRQLRLSLRGVIYVDEGWQKLVDSLHSSAVAAGVHFVSSSRIVAVHHDDSVRAVELGGFELDDTLDTQSLQLPADLSTHEAGTKLPCDTLVLAVDPATVRELVPELPLPRTSPVMASCLDVALKSLPNPKQGFALGIDTPTYLSVHSQWAQLTPKGGALVHVARYGRGDEQEMTALLDEVQSGWRESVVHKRFLPAMTVANAMDTPDLKRPGSTTPIANLYLAGDWIGDEGMLADASLTSARAAAKAIIASSG